MFGLFETLAAAIFGVTVFGITVDDELYRTINTLANLATVALLVWHQRHVRRQLEPQVQQATALIKRKLGDRDPSRASDWDGEERRGGTP